MRRIGVIEKARLNGPLTPRALVIGGGIAGMQAALGIANSGHNVILVEREPSIGGHMVQLSETFPTLDCSFSIVTPKEVGAIVVATGYETYPILHVHEYGSGSIPDVIDSLAFDRLLSASDPTDGEVRRPSDGRVPKNVVFIQCVASRCPEGYFPYCSKICCMYTAKHAMLYKQRVHDGQAYIFYMDIRAGGKHYEEFVQRASEEEKAISLRGRVSKLYREDNKVVVCGVDTLSGGIAEIHADLVVLATAMRPANGIDHLSKILQVDTDAHGFLTEAHPKLRPVESMTAGTYLAGCAQAPRDIPDTVSQASGAAAMVTGLFASLA